MTYASRIMVDLMAEGRRESSWSRAGRGSLVTVRARGVTAAAGGGGGGRGTAGSFSFEGEETAGLEGTSAAVDDRGVDLPLSRATTRAWDSGSAAD